MYVKCGNCGHVAEVFKVEGSKWVCPKCNQSREIPVSKDEYLKYIEEKKKRLKEIKKGFQTRLQFFE